MIGARRVAVLAFADELGSDPSLLATWAAAFDGRDEMTLVIHPGTCSEEEAVPQIRAAVRAAGIADDDKSAHLLALARAPHNGEELELAHQCAAVYGRRKPLEPFDRLPRLSGGPATKLRNLLTIDCPRHLLAPPRRQVFTINDTWDIAHRGTKADLGVLQQIFVHQHYSLAAFERWPGLNRYADMASLGARPLIIDCGANIGASSMYFAIMYPEARIVAVEPEVENFKLLADNVRPFPEIRPVNRAIASEEGTLLLCDPGTGEWAYRTTSGTPDVKVVGSVQATSVNDILAEQTDVVPFILKVDIEGAEGDLFSKNTEAFSQFAVVIVELHDWLLPGKATSASFLRWHVSQERDFVYRGENVFSLASSLCAN
jgi:FkbM family methyltransferase